MTVVDRSDECFKRFQEIGAEDDFMGQLFLTPGECSA